MIKVNKLLDFLYKNADYSHYEYLFKLANKSTVEEVLLQEFPEVYQVYIFQKNSYDEAAKKISEEDAKKLKGSLPRAGAFLNVARQIINKNILKDKVALSNLIEVLNIKSFKGLVSILQGRANDLKENKFVEFFKDKESPDLTEELKEKIFKSGIKKNEFDYIYNEKTRGNHTIEQAFEMLKDIHSKTDAVKAKNKDFSMNIQDYSDLDEMANQISRVLNESNYGQTLRKLNRFYDYIWNGPKEGEVYRGYENAIPGGAKSNSKIVHEGADYILVHSTSKEACQYWERGAVQINEDGSVVFNTCTSAIKGPEGFDKTNYFSHYEQNDVYQLIRKSEMDNGAPKFYSNASGTPENLFTILTNGYGDLVSDYGDSVDANNNDITWENVAEAYSEDTAENIEDEIRENITAKRLIKDDLAIRDVSVERAISEFKKVDSLQFLKRPMAYYIRDKFPEEKLLKIKPDELFDYHLNSLSAEAYFELLRSLLPKLTPYIVTEETFGDGHKADRLGNDNKKIISLLPLKYKELGSDFLKFTTPDVFVEFPYLFKITKDIFYEKLSNLPLMTFVTNETALSIINKDPEGYLEFDKILKILIDKSYKDGTLPKDVLLIGKDIFHKNSSIGNVIRVYQEDIYADFIDTFKSSEQVLTAVKIAMSENSYELSDLDYTMAIEELTKVLPKEVFSDVDFEAYNSSISNLSPKEYFMYSSFYKNDEFIGETIKKMYALEKLENKILGPDQILRIKEAANKSGKYKEFQLALKFLIENSDISMIIYSYGAGIINLTGDEDFIKKMLREYTSNYRNIVNLRPLRSTRDKTLIDIIYEKIPNELVRAALKTSYDCTGGSSVFIYLLSSKNLQGLLSIEEFYNCYLKNITRLHMQGMDHYLKNILMKSILMGSGKIKDKEVRSEISKAFKKAYPHVDDYFESAARAHLKPFAFAKKIKEDKEGQEEIYEGFYKDIARSYDPSVFLEYPILLDTFKEIAMEKINKMSPKVFVREGFHKSHPEIFEKILSKLKIQGVMNLGLQKHVSRDTVYSKVRAEGLQSMFYREGSLVRSYPYLAFEMAKALHSKSPDEIMNQLSRIGNAFSNIYRADDIEKSLIPEDDTHAKELGLEILKLIEKAKETVTHSWDVAMLNGVDRYVRDLLGNLYWDKALRSDFEKDISAEVTFDEKDSINEEEDSDEQ